MPAGLAFTRSAHWPVLGFLFLALQGGAAAQGVSEAALAAAGRNLLVVYRNASLAPDVEQSVRRTGARFLHEQERFGTAVVNATAAAEAQLRSDPSVEYVIEDRVVSANSMFLRSVPHELAANESQLTPPLRANPPRLVLPADTADTYYTGSPQGWAVRAVGGFGGAVADSATAGPWATSTGLGVRIAVLDSGVDRNHPDIAPNLALNLSEVNQAAQPSPCDDGSPQDQTGHGTWVASLAAVRPAMARDVLSALRRRPRC